MDINYYNIGEIMKYNDLKNNTCAGIVLYNPEMDKLEKNITAIITQVEKLVLINNDSNNIDEVYSLLKKYDSNIEIINNKENLGIAKALNQIIEYARKNNYKWYITMDQDSCCSDNLMLEYSKVLTEETDIAVLCPYVLNNGKETIEEMKQISLPATTEIIQPIDCITSGTLNNVKFAIEAGGYDDNLFIDCVDVDFNMKLLLLNKKIIRVNSCYLVQYMGEGKSVWFIQCLYKITGKNIFKRLRFTPIYSNFRIYYIFRNSRIMWQRYGKLAGKKISKKWMRFQFLYYFATYPFSYNRLQLIKAYRRAIKDAGVVN